MSVKIMARVWEESQHKGSTLLLLLAIADHANDDGICWPSVETLAAKARVKPRQAQNLLTQLETSGELVVRRGHGRKNTSIYVVAIGQKGAVDCTFDRAEKVQSSVEKVQSSAEKVQSSVRKGAIAIAPDPSEPSIEPSLDPSARAAAEPPAPPPPPAAPSVEAEKPNTKSLVQQPAVLAYRDVFLAYPSKAQMVQICAAGIDDLQQWTAVLTAWCQAGYSPRNIGGMLDWYADPQRMAVTRPQTRSPTAPRSKVEASMDAVDRVMAMVERSQQQ